MGEGIRVGYPTEHVKVFPMESETEARLYFSGPVHDERSLEVLSPLLAEKLRQAQALLELQHKAHTDPLTGLLNRRGLERQTPRLLAQARRESRPVTLALLDLDHFKRVNDTYGHARGDQVLQTLANVLRSHLRSEDLAVRWGGEEFALLLYGTKTEEAHAALERIRSELRNLDGLLEWPLTLSAELAGGRVPASEVEFEGWIGQADQALMRAKEDGRDRVNLAGLFGES
ncbi:MAG TPA: GGDEF domain-containing protein [Meiothermus sp.]|nr:GGDEF domain-containing protein [Meiothermus sp.]